MPNPGGEGRFTPLKPLGTTAFLASYATIGCCLVATGGLIRRIIVLAELPSGRSLPDDVPVADQLVDFGGFAVAVAIVVTALLTLRWARAVRANRSPLADPGLAGERAWWILWPVAIVAFLITRLTLGQAAEPSGREFRDALELLAGVLVAAAAMLTIRLISRVSARQAAAAREGGVRVLERVDDDRPEAQSGLTVMAAREPEESKPRSAHDEA